MKITLGEEQVVAIGPRYEDSYWGQFQFPFLHQGENGEIIAKVHNGDDDWEELGMCDLWFSTTDCGETWQPRANGGNAAKGVLLPNGDRLMPAARPTVTLDLTKVQAPMKFATMMLPSDDIYAKSTDVNRLPQPRGAYWDVYGQKHCVYNVESLPDGLFEHLDEWPMMRTKAGESEAKPEWVKIHGWNNMALHLYFKTKEPKAVPLLPQCLGHLKVGPDGRLWTAVNWSGLNPKNAGFKPFQEVFVLYSDDNGYNWHLQGHVPYIPDTDEYENAYICAGYCEPDFEFAPDGSMVMLLRTTDVFKGDKEWAPSYITRSTDDGKTWSKPVRFDDIGILPGLCRVGGVTLAIYGRPGIYVRGTADPAAMQWEPPVEVMTNKDRSGLMNEPPARPNFWQWEGSCCNSKIMPLDDTHAMIAYSDFYHLCEDGVRRKSIKTRIVTVER